VNLIGCGEWFGSSGLEIQATKKPLTHFCAGGQATSRAHRLSRPGHISLSPFTTLIGSGAILAIPGKYMFLSGNGFPGFMPPRRDLLQIGASAYFRIYLTFHVRGHRDE
jgi:hypothetical protein